MSRRLRHHQPASRRLHDVLGLLATLLVLVCLEVSFSGLAFSDARTVSGSLTPETFSAPASPPQPIALSGPRGLALVAGLGEGRQRTGQLVEPGASLFTASIAGHRDGQADSQPRPPLALTHGLLTVRAPPPDDPS